MDEKERLLYALSSTLMANEKREAEAVEGYNKQLELIDALRNVSEDDAELTEFLNTLEAATKEKISDELNHGASLYAEYVQMTGIKPAED